MQSAFGDVIWIVCLLGIVIGVVALAGSGKTWREFGRRGLVMDGDKDGSGGSRRGGSGVRRGTGGSSAGGFGGNPAELAERDEEIRQMLEARNLRRARRGEAPVDIEVELARLTAERPVVDDELRSEIRDMVVARNHRRARRGQPPLDVEAEIEREIAELVPPE